MAKTDSASTSDERAKIRERLNLPPVIEPIVKSSKIEEDNPLSQEQFDILVSSAEALGEAGDIAFQEAQDLQEGKFFKDTGLTAYEQYLKDAATAQRQDAFESILVALQPYNLEGLSDTIYSLMADPNIGSNQALYKLKYDTTINPATNKPWNLAYATRFPANAERVKQGKPALSEAEYLSAEQTYSQVLRSYGLPNMANRSNFDKFITNDVSPSEVADRVTLAIDRVQNADQATKDALAAYYPELRQGDLISAVLDPAVQVPNLKRKIQLAEIGGTADIAGLGRLSETRAAEIANAGVSEAQARQGFQTIAQSAPRGGQLAAIYQQGAYTQQTAESELFNLSGAKLASEERKKLVGLEKAAFSGGTGLTSGALARDRAGSY
jgi:hypothetical protein